MNLLHPSVYIVSYIKASALAQLSFPGLVLCFIVGNFQTEPHIASSSRLKQHSAHFLLCTVASSLESKE